MLIDTAPQYMGGIPAEDRLTALHGALANCATLGDLNAFLASAWGRSALRGESKQEAARAISRRFHELCATAPGGPARTGNTEQGQV